MPTSWALLPSTLEPGPPVPAHISAWDLLPGWSPMSRSSQERLQEQLGNRAGNTQPLPRPQPYEGSHKQERVKGLGLVAFDED